MRPQLLVSVRSADEALEALAGGADLIDVKDPANGALGRADAATWSAVRAAVKGRKPTSAALGELIDFDDAPPSGFDFVKAGPACLDEDAWRRRMDAFRLRAGTRAVIVGYADAKCSHAPPVEAIAEYAEEVGGVLLIDTGCKENRSTLTDWLPLAWLADRICRIHRAGGCIALAGSLGPADMEALIPLAPDWIAVRGAACGGDRQGTVTRVRVAALRELLS